MLHRFLFILSFMFVGQCAYADEASDQAEFNELYKTFTDLYANSEDIDPIIEVAERVYALSAKVHGKNSINYANITYNLASLYDEKGGTSSSESEQKASDLYKEYFNILDELNTPKDKTYLEQYMNFIKTESNAEQYKSKDRYSEKALKVAEEIPISNTEMAELEFIVALIKTNAGKVILAKKYFDLSKARYISEYGDSHVALAQISFWLAKIEMARDKRENAEKYFLNTIDIYEKNNAKGADLALTSHAFLVQLYEDMGQSDIATKHCLAVSVERPIDFDRYITPLYRIPPNYPSSAARRLNEGDVIVEFTVDTEGFTKDIKVIDSSDNQFDNESIKAVEKFRFAPSVRDGKIIETNGVRNHIKFVIAK